MKYLLRVLSAQLLALGLSAAPPAGECQDKLAACAKADNCANKPDSAQCKACKAAYDDCSANAKEPRGAAKKTTKR
jgi:hypothetical protein